VVVGQGDCGQKSFEMRCCEWGDFLTCVKCPC
jgi:hypothetical protein